MNVHFQQSERLGRLATALGEDVLALLRFSGEEHINTLFEYRVEALSPTNDIDFDALIGTHATVEIDHPDHGPQPFDGIVTRARYCGAGSGGYRYELELRPWLWLTSKRRNQQIFHRMSVVEILHDLWDPYADLGAPALEMHLNRDYPELEYTVQFGESDLDFACRLMERFGISYYFQQTQGSHTLMLIDSAGALDAIPGTDRPFYSAGAHLSTETERFSDWRTERSMTTGAVKLTDYNFKKPGARMITARRGDAKYSEAYLEAYDWPGRYLDLGRGEEAEIGLRVDQERGQDRRTYAEGNCLSLKAGHKVRLAGDPMPGETGETFICLSAGHSYTSNAYGSSDESSGGNEYSGTYTLMPVDAPLAPRRKTPLAFVHGPHTATVVGEGEIDCDEYGRILVRFHWDLDHAHSMRCRVSQNWASKGWGGMVIPRIGMEVVVEFLDGDPDKPLVTGCVYNGRNDCPYPLPEHKTRSTFKTDTHEGKGFNELRFEDKRDQEEVYIHAQKDMNVDVLDTHTTHVRNNKTELVENNRVVEVNRNHSEVIGGNMSIHVGPTHIGRFISAGIFRLVEQLGSFSKSFGIPGALDPGSGNLTVTVEKNALEAVGLTSVHTVGIDESTFVGRNSKLNAGKEIKVNAGELVRIVCGKSTIEMKENGELTLNGDKININAATLVKINGKTVDIN